MYENFLSMYSDKKSCHTSTTLQISIARFSSIARFVSDSWASCIRSCLDTRAHATVANNVTVWWAELLVWVARSCMTLVRRYLSLRSCLRSCGFRDTRLQRTFLSHDSRVLQLFSSGSHLFVGACSAVHWLYPTLTGTLHEYNRSLIYRYNYRLLKWDCRSPSSMMMMIIFEGLYAVNSAEQKLVTVQEKLRHRIKLCKKNKTSLRESNTVLHWDWGKSSLRSSLVSVVSAVCLCRKLLTICIKIKSEGLSSVSATKAGNDKKHKHVVTIILIILTNN